MKMGLDIEECKPLQNTVVSIIRYSFFMQDWREIEI